MFSSSFNFFSPWIAHRGASGYAPENTMVAFVKALQMGALWIEFDVMQAACGELLIFHDQTLERTTNGQGRFIDFPCSYLKTLDAGRWFNPIYAGERIPTFLETMQFVSQAKIAVNIEMKPYPGKEKQFITRLLAQFNQLPMTASFLFSSFSFPALLEFRKQAPTYPVAYIMHQWDDKWLDKAKTLKCVAIHLNEAIATPERINEIKKENYNVACYTINKLPRANELFSWGVNSLFSDVFFTSAINSTSTNTNNHSPNL